ncbi:ATP-dependent metallopeptidase FtsH/Yme1/Tma family protein [Candidatus Peregrinibacteria bacterium]|nr:ATP-dependent metallopeptidase FtsH/Yme1/Tma family protein [Candidatus Peregrinibacteria bacterium]
MAKSIKKKGPSPLISILIVALLVSAIYSIWNPSSKTPSEKVNINQFVADVESGEVIEVKVEDTRITYTLSNETEKYTYKERGQTVNEVLEGTPEVRVKQLEIEVVDTSGKDVWLNIGLAIVPFMLIIGFLYFMMRGAAGANNQAMSFGKSGARLHDKEKGKTSFKDVAGVAEAKEELEEVVDFLKHPSKYRAMGAKIPRGAMLIGAPGTGKTLLARAVAGEANVPFFTISGSEFVEMFVGVGASRVRDTFKKAKRNVPCIIFIDEIDAVGRKRGAGLGGGHDEREQTLNQILTEMDGFENETSVIVMAATNRPDVLDPALLRPGRFDRRIVVDKPSMQGREEILEVHARNKPMAKNVDLKLVAGRTPGFTGADLENLLNEAAIRAAKYGQKEITANDISEAIEKVSLGPERKSHIMSDEEKKLTAYHEMGHAVVGHALAGCNPVQKVTIIPRGMALGVTWYTPEKDEYSLSKEKFQHRMAAALGGYAAEEIIYGQVSTGPASDLQKVTQMARDMVTRYGMSKIGPISLGDQNDEVFLGKDFGHVKNYSEEQAALIDKEVKHFVESAHKLAKDTLKKHDKTFKRLSKALLKKESIDRKEFLELFEGKKLKKKSA